MKRLKYFGAFVAISAIGAAVLVAVAKMEFWIAFGISALAVLANGAIANIEDDAPGGFNNPDGSATPAYVSRVFVMLKIFAGILVLLIVAAVGYDLLGGSGSHAG